MIASGEKKEEYREVKKHWINRFTWHEYHWMTPEEIIREYKNGVPAFKDKFWEVIEFKNGYGKNAPTKVVEFKGIEIRTGNLQWGAEPGKEYFVIKLGHILNPQP